MDQSFFDCAASLIMNALNLALSGSCAGLCRCCCAAWAGAFSPGCASSQSPQHGGDLMSSARLPEWNHRLVITSAQQAVFAPSALSSSPARIPNLLSYLLAQVWFILYLSSPAFLIHWLNSSKHNTAPGGVQHCRNPCLKTGAGLSLYINWVSYLQGISSYRELCVSLSMADFCQVLSFHSKSVPYQPCLQFIPYKLRCCNWTSPSLHSLVLKFVKSLILALITSLRDYRHPVCLFLY